MNPYLDLKNSTRSEISRRNSSGRSFSKVKQLPKCLDHSIQTRKPTLVQPNDAGNHGCACRTSSCPSSSDSEPEKEVFPATKETPCKKPVQKEPEVFCLKTRPSSSSGSEGMVSDFQTPSFQTPGEKGRMKELQKTMESVKKEKDDATGKLQKSVNEVDALQSQLAAMENKQKQLLQQIECTRHNVEASRKHQEERMKEKEREYREDISTQTKALVELEQGLKEKKVKLDQAQKSSDIRVKEFEVSTKKLREEFAAALDAVHKLELEKTEQRSSVESCKNTIAELRKELRTITEIQAVAAKNVKGQTKAVEDLSHQLEATNVELEEKKQMVIELEEARESWITEERGKYLELLKARESECSDAVARVKELEKSLEVSGDSESENDDVLSKRYEELTSQVKKMTSLFEQKEQETLTLKMSLEEKNKEVENIAALLEKCTNSEELKTVSEEKLQLENNLCSVRHVCEALKEKLKESEMEVSQVDALRQVLQMDLEDKNELMKTLEQQKATSESGFHENLQKITQLRDDLRSVDEEMVSFRSENEVLKNGVEELESTKKQLQEVVAQIRITLANAIDSKASLAEELSKAADEKEKMCEVYEVRTGELERTLNELRCVRDISEKNALSQLNNKLTETEKTLDERTRELDSVIPRYKSLQEDFHLAVVKLEKVTADLDCTRNRVNILDSQKSNLLSDVKTTEEQRDDKIKMLAEMEARLSENDRLISSLRRSNEEILEKQNAEFKSAESKTRELSEECQEKTRLLTQESEKVDELCTERDRLTESVERLRAERLEKGHQMQKYADQCQDFERSNAEYKATVEQLHGELSMALEQAENQHASFEEKYSKLKEDLVLSKDGTRENNNTIEEMQRNMESLKSEKDVLSVENDELKSKHFVTLQEAEKVSVRCNEFSEMLAQQEDIVNEYKFTVEQLENDSAITRELYETTKIRLSDDLMKSKDELRSEKENLNALRNDLSEKLFCISSLTVEKECLQMELENAKTEMQLISEKFTGPSTENNQEVEIEILQKKVEMQEASLEEYRAEKEEHETLQRMHDKAITSLERSKDTLASLQDSLKESTLEKEKLCHELRKNVDTYEALVSSINEEKSALENAVGNYKNTIEEIQDQLDSQVRRTESTEYLLKQKDEELFVTNKELDSKMIDVQRLEKGCEERQEVELELRHHLGVVTQELEAYKDEGDRREQPMKANKKIKELEEAMAAKTSKLEEEREEIVTKTKEFALQLKKEYTEKTDHLEGELRKKEQMLSNACEENYQLSHQLATELKSKKILLSEIEERENEIELEKETMVKTPLSPVGRLKEVEADLEEERRLTKRLQETCTDLNELMLKEQKNRVGLQKKVKSLQAEIPTTKEKDEKISSLESDVEALSQQFDSLNSELESEKVNNITLENEVVQLEQKGVKMEKRLQDEAIKNEMLRIEYEQLKQSDFDVYKGESDAMATSTNEKAESMKVCELEYCIDSLKKEMAEQKENIALGEDNLKRALHGKDTLERSLDEELKRKQELVEKMKQKVLEDEHREEKMSALKTQVDMVSKQFASAGTELEVERANKVAFEKEIEELRENEVNMKKRLQDETAKVCELQRCLDALKKELARQQEKVTLGDDSLKRAMASNVIHERSLAEKVEFIEKKKAEVFEMEEKCSSLRGKCADSENKLNEVRQNFKLEKVTMEEKLTSLSRCYDDTKRKLADSEDENKPMMDRLLQLEGEMIMMPAIQGLQTELEQTKKELNDEKENVAKYEKLSRDYSNKLNEFTTVNNGMPPHASSKLVSKTEGADEKVPVTPPRNRQPSKDEQNQKRLTITLTKDVQKDKGHSSEITPVICEEKQLFLSPITRSLSKLGFSSPSAPEQSDLKKPSELLKKTVTRKIQRTNIKAPSNLPEDRKRKDVKDTVQSNAKRMRCDSSIELPGARSPFVLNRNRGIQTRSKVSSQQSRLPHPSSRIPQSKARTRIPKRTVVSEKNATAVKGSLKLPTSERSQEECKMQ